MDAKKNIPETHSVCLLITLEYKKKTFKNRNVILSSLKQHSNNFCVFRERDLDYSLRVVLVFGLFWILRLHASHFNESDSSSKFIPH